jgi:hypothetical protein
MKGKLIDLSQPVYTGMPVYPILQKTSFSVTIPLKNGMSANSGPPVRIC